MLKTILAAVAWAASAAWAQASPDAVTPADRAVPHYDHIFVIVEENKDYAQVMGPAAAPDIAGLAATYGVATQFFSEGHPSEANYVALLGGDTFGIHDDDAFYCHLGMIDPACPNAFSAGYADHTVAAPSLADQLQGRGLSWKGYYESLPAAGSLAVRAADPATAPGADWAPVYASKHSGFLNFANVQRDPKRAEHIVGFGQLDADLASGDLPNFALIVPNQCNEMHGLHGPGVPADCDAANGLSGLIGRGDRVVGQLVRRIQATPAWRSNQRVAIVVTFDEGAGKTREGCCSVTPEAPSNFGGGHIPTIVITNHGPRGVKDAVPYNHYSLLRTIEDAFGISTHLGRAADTAGGVTAMAGLF